MTLVSQDERVCCCSEQLNWVWEARYTRTELSCTESYDAGVLGFLILSKGLTEAVQKLLREISVLARSSSIEWSMLAERQNRPGSMKVMQVRGDWITEGGDRGFGACTRGRFA